MQHEIRVAASRMVAWWVWHTETSELELSLEVLSNISKLNLQKRWTRYYFYQQTQHS